jgi:hypothetical protein
MSLIAIALNAATAGDVTATAPPPPPAILMHTVDVALPSLDTGRGLAAGFETWLPAWRLAYELRGEVRESATGDYTGWRFGTGCEAKWFWRADRGAWLSVLPPGSMAGWFLGAGAYLAADRTHDDLDQRWLGTTLQIGTAARVGYRIAPWRALAITPSAGLEVQRDIDLSGRLSGAFRGGALVGLDAGWMF